jgi:hypothetical protein
MILFDQFLFLINSASEKRVFIGVDIPFAISKENVKQYSTFLFSTRNIYQWFIYPKYIKMEAF